MTVTNVGVILKLMTSSASVARLSIPGEGSSPVALLQVPFPTRFQAGKVGNDQLLRRKTMEVVKHEGLELARHFKALDLGQRRERTCVSAEARLGVGDTG